MPAPDVEESRGGTRRGGRNDTEVVASRRVDGSGSTESGWRFGSWLRSFFADDVAARRSRTAPGRGEGLEDGRWDGREGRGGGDETMRAAGVPHGSEGREGDIEEGGWGVRGGEAARRSYVAEHGGDRVEEGEEEEEPCAVCQDGMAGRDRVTVLPCSHCFHAACLAQWLLRKVRSAEEERWIGLATVVAG